MTALPDAVRTLLLGPNIAHAATVMPDGMPHVVPTWVGVEGEHIVARSGHVHRPADAVSTAPTAPSPITPPPATLL